MTIKVFCNNKATNKEFFLFKRNVSTNQMVRVGIYSKPREEVTNGKTLYLGYPNSPLVDSSKAINMYDSGFYIKDGNYDGVMEVYKFCHFDEGFYHINPMPYDLEQINQINANHPEFSHYTIGFTTLINGTTKTLVTLWDYYIIDKKE